MHSKDLGRLRIVSIGLLDGALDENLFRFLDAVMQRVDGLAGGGRFLQNGFGKILGKNQFGRSRTTARSIAFSSSRTLPGHS